MIKSYLSKINRTSQYNRDRSSFLRLDANERVIPFNKKTINEREEMYSNVFKLLVEIQKDYILKGERYIKSLKLSDIAQQLNVHESTISRITSNKYISTPRGMLNMKRFFVNKINSSSEKSSAAVRDIIEELIGMEDKKSPLTDDNIKSLLDEACPL